MDHSTQPRPPVTDRQLSEAEVGLRRLLRKRRFPTDWVDRYCPELMSQARAEYAARLRVEPVENTVGLLVVIGYRRAQNLVRSERSRPRLTSIETAFHLADEDTPTPEERALAHDRQLRLVNAMGHLPERERKLLALVYFEELPLGAAGRRLGWAKASATRHHQAALDRLRTLVGDRSLLSPELAVPAYVAAHKHSFPRAAMTWIGGAAETLREAAFLGSTRVGPAADAGNAAALGGAGRTAAGVCAVAASCIVAATGVVGPGVKALTGDGGVRAARPHRQSVPAAGRSRGAPNPSEAPASQTLAAPPSTRTAPRASRAAQTRGVEVPEQHHRNRPERSAAAPLQPTHTENVNEFGVEKGEAEPAEESTGASPSISPPATARPVAPTSSDTSTPPHSTNPSSKAPSAGSEARSEFGM